MEGHTEAERRIEVEEPEIVVAARARIALDGGAVDLVLASRPAAREWAVVGRSDPPRPIVACPGGVVLFVERRRTTPARAQRLFERICAAVAGRDLRALRRLCRGRERDDQFFSVAFGLMSEEAAMRVRRHHEVQAVLRRDWQDGRISRAEYERLRLSAYVSMAASPARA